MQMMNTVDKTFKLCKENNIGISRNAIRQLANAGKIPCVRIGNKLLINYQGLIKFLNSNFVTPEKTPDTGIIPIKP